MKKIEEYPLYILLQKINEGGIVKEYQEKFLEHLKEMDQQNLNKEHVDYIKRLVVVFLNEKLQKYFEHYYINSIKNNNKEYLYKFLNIYQYLLDNDKKHKTNVWDPSTIALLDSNSDAREFLDKHYPSIFKQNIYKQKGAELLSERLLSLPNFTQSLYDEKMYNIHMNNVVKLIERYDEKNFDWSKLVKKSPSLSLAILCKNYNYEIKKEDFFNIFHHTKNNIKKQYNIDTNDIIEKVSDAYNSLLINSVFFKNSLAPSKNIHQALSKFLESEVVTNKEYFDLPFYQVFNNCVLTSKDYDVINYETKLEKHSYYKVMGKWLLTPQEKEECKKIIEISKIQTPKRNKI